jgi:hypothetical protein
MYLNEEATLSEYYAQFVTERELEVVKNIDIKSSLRTWDNLPEVNFASRCLMDKLNDSYSLAGKVCIYKTARRMLDNLEDNLKK